MALRIYYFAVCILPTEHQSNNSLKREKAYRYGVRATGCARDTLSTGTYKGSLPKGGGSKAFCDELTPSEETRR